MPSRDARSVCPPFGVFRGRIPSSEPPESSAPCWCAVATGYPLGNCDSPKIETGLGYLTRLGAVSDCSWPPSSMFALLTRATAPEELVNFASARAPCDAHAKGSFPPAGPDLSPVTWDYLGDLRQSQLPQLPISRPYWKCLNINRLAIGCGLRLPLRTRLTLARLALTRNP